MSSRCLDGRGLLLALLAAGALAACEREDRQFRNWPPAASATTAIRESPLQPGPTTREDTLHPEYESNGWAVAQGKRLYNQFNCSGCHFQGGGGIGPPLMDAQWIYGSEPENIYETIVEGRPNGMPSFKARLGNDQIWQLVAYVRSMSGLVPVDAAPSRDDAMQSGPAENRRAAEVPVPAAAPPSSQQSK
jgi:cytochrome c oxidase cbb3-type subunit III